MTWLQYRDHDFTGSVAKLFVVAAISHTYDRGRWSCSGQTHRRPFDRRQIQETHRPIPRFAVVASWRDLKAEQFLLVFLDVNSLPRRSFEFIHPPAAIQQTTDIPFAESPFPFLYGVLHTPRRNPIKIHFPLGAAWQFSPQLLFPGVRPCSPFASLPSLPDSSLSTGVLRSFVTRV